MHTVFTKSKKEVVVYGRWDGRLCLGLGRGCSSVEKKLAASREVCF